MYTVFRTLLSSSLGTLRRRRGGCLSAAGCCLPVPPF
jgi:hypothetical protein